MSYTIISENKLNITGSLFLLSADLVCEFCDFMNNNNVDYLSYKRFGFLTLKNSYYDKNIKIIDEFITIYCPANSPIKIGFKLNTHCFPEKKYSLPFYVLVFITCFLLMVMLIIVLYMQVHQRKELEMKMDLSKSVLFDFG